MSRVNVAVELGGPRSPVVSTRLIASAHSWAERAQSSIEALGGASNLLLLLTGVGLGLVASYLTGAMAEGDAQGVEQA
jgi:hypothetical protein